jgi:hypothetical protein
MNERTSDVVLGSEEKNLRSHQPNTTLIPEVYTPAGSPMVVTTDATEANAWMLANGRDLGYSLSKQSDRNSR